LEFLTETRVPERHARLRIDIFLARCYGYLTRTEWQRQIRSGKIVYNGAVLTRHDKRINAGDLVFYTGRDAPEPEVDANYSVLFEDDFLMVINKPGNLPVHPAGIFYHNTLLTLLQKRFQMKLHLLHRLDRETSGAVMLAKNAQLAAHFQKNFTSVGKAYLALVHGVPQDNDFIVDVPIESDPLSMREHRRAAFAGAREKACTRFVRLFSFSEYSLVKALPYTGRQHQIRVHLKHAGYPIVGDKVYGAACCLLQEFIKKGYNDEMSEKIKFHRSALHSRMVRFRHPALNKTVCVRAPLPDDMQQFIDLKRGSNV
jgi:23S rRNA pseudouridine1911/1915/1917 synthase